MIRNRTLKAAAAFNEFHGSDPDAFGLIEAAAAPAEGGKPAQPTVSGVAYSGGLLAVNWGRPVVVDLAGLRASESVAYLKDHDRGQVVGQGQGIITAKNIKAQALVTGDTEEKGSPAYEVVSHAGRGFKWPLSIGVWPDKVEEVAAGAKVNVNGRSFNGPLYVVRAGALREISFVSIGGDEHASAKIAASAAGENIMEPTFAQWLTAQGKDPNALSDADKAPLQAAYDALKVAGLLVAAAPAPAPAKPAETTPAGDDPAKALRATQAAEWKRQGMIATKAGKYPDLAAKATEEGWDEARLTAEVTIADLRAARPKGPAIHTNDAPVLTADVCEASLCATARLPGLDKQFKPETLEASHQFGRIGLQESIMLAALAGGWAPRGLMTASTFRAQHKAILTAAFGVSSIDIAGILSNVANKFLLSSFNTVESIWRRIASTRPMSDFKTATTYRMTSAGGFQKVAPGGEIKHGTLSEESRTNKLETYGKMLAITRQDQYNDDLGAITQVPAQLGGDAARALNTAFWAEFQDNAAFFSSGNKNLAGTGGRPFYLVVDPSKGGADMAVMEVAFLDGRDSPIIETAEADFNMLGIQIRAYMDWGCKKAEYRGGVRSSTALSLASLEAANKLFLDQKMDGTHPLGIMPNILLVATGDQVLAKQIFVSAEMRDTTATTKSLNANTWQGSFEPLVSAYLANS